MSKPVAVLISDVHYNLQTVKLADAAMRLAIDKAHDLQVPLIVAGDLHDSKANMRAECVNTMINTFDYADELGLSVFVLRGNHDQVNEKSKDTALTFLKDYVCLVENKCELGRTGLFAIPYEHDPVKLAAELKTIPKGSTIIMHQGLINSNAGHYFQDSSAITEEDVQDFRVISGHYHTRQTIKCRPLPRCIGGSFKAIQEEHRLHNSLIGTWDYIGNPYTLNYGEANDPPKGFQVLYDDGKLEFVPTNLRRHIVINMRFNEIEDVATYDLLPDGRHPGSIANEDLVWIKVTGTREQLSTVTKAKLASGWKLKQDFKLELIPLESETSKPIQVNQSQPEILDGLIDSLTNTSDDQKTRIKNLWRGI